tara:strand:+ start:2089 stop:4140 length:2052 start_codon:yes stop_codon:yes gene_type:complete
MTKSFKEMQGIKEACWVGYKQVGMKKKGDRMVPNCVKEEVVDAVFGKDYVYQENYQDMYKGKLNKDQIATIKNTWAGKKASDVTQGVRDMVKNMDQFTRMDIKKANIKHISALINDEYDFALPLSDLIEMQEFNAAVRHTELKEFTDEQISKLAKSYADLAGKTMSIQNANKLRKLFDRIPDSSLNKLRKKKIPFISGLALSRMIQKKIPVNESAYNDESAWEVSGVENEGREELQEVKVYRVSHPSKKTYEVEGDNEKEAIRRYKDEVGLKSDSGIRTLLIKDHGEEIKEADLTKSQTKKVHKMADELPKKDFRKRYGKDGDAVRYATATNMLKKKMGIGESKFKLNKGELKMSESYKQRFDSAMEHIGISSLGELNQEDQKPFFAYVDNLKEGLSAAQKKLPPALQKAIAKKQDDKSEKHKPGHKEETKEGFGANRPSKPNAYKSYMKKTGQKLYKNELSPKQKKLDVDKDGDIGGDDLAKLRSMKKEGGPGSGPQPGDGAKYKTGHKKSVMKPGAGARPGSAKDGGQTDKEADDYDTEINASKKMKKEYGTGNMMASKKSTMSMPIKPASKMKEEKTKETDSEPKMKDLNAMVKDPHKSKEDKPMKDMNAMYMKSNVKAPVKDGGGADMAKVKDKPIAQEPMKKINAMYKESNRPHRYLDTKPGSLEEAVLKSRGLIKSE